jgi:aspartyl-tRNA(Asn)/glutamyl-tRNA(Gln) amidotransferase subunit A
MVDSNTLIEAARAVRASRVRPTQLVEHALERIEQTRDLNAIAYLDAEGALNAARELDREARQGHFRGLLHGAPITVKDLFNVKGMPTRAGTRALLPPITPEEAPAITRLKKAGAIILAKTNMVEIALGVTGENPWTGDVKNPHDSARQAGGSSSGSAASLAAGVAWGSIGSDTAGSIRIPAAFCGVVGFKPTYGLVSLDGALALCPSCDHAGPITRSVADAAVMFAVMANRKDLSGLEHLTGLKPPALGVPRQYLDGALSAEARAAFELSIERLRERGAAVKDVVLEGCDRVIDAFAPLRAESVHIHRKTLETNPDIFSPYARDSLMRGFEFSALQYLDARHEQLVMREAVHRSLHGVDALILPTAPAPAPLRGATEVELESGRKNERLAILHLTAPFSFTGVPALSLPFARTTEGLPLGLQVVTPFDTDDRTLMIGAWIEQALR